MSSAGHHSTRIRLLDLTYSVRNPLYALSPLQRRLRDINLRTPFSERNPFKFITRMVPVP